MSLAQLKDQVTHLEAVEQRELIAFLFSLQTAKDHEFKRELARKIDDADPSHRVDLDELRQHHQPRPSGLCAGEFVTPADFDDPLSADILRDFEGA